MEINGLPTHPLVIHAAVVFVPLAAVIAVVFAVVPRWRWATRWPMIVTSLIALVAATISWFSGRALRDERVAAGIDATRYQRHEELADILICLVLVFFVVMVLAAWALGGPSGLASGKGARGHHAPFIEWSSLLMLVMLAVFMITVVVATGEAGTRLGHTV